MRCQACQDECGVLIGGLCGSCYEDENPACDGCGQTFPTNDLNTYGMCKACQATEDAIEAADNEVSDATDDLESLLEQVKAAKARLRQARKARALLPARD
jgi:hypothetical protein